MTTGGAVHTSWPSLRGRSTCALGMELLLLGPLRQTRDHSEDTPLRCHMPASFASQ